jgi:hypothetical protein
MKKLKKKLLFLALFYIVNSCFASLFIIKTNKNKKSITNLKEDLAALIKDTLFESIEFNSQMGALQQTFYSMLQFNSNNKNHAIDSVGKLHANFGKLLCITSQLQHLFSRSLEKIIDNKQPFKRTTKAKLKESIETLTTTHTILFNHKNMLLGKKYTTQQQIEKFSQQSINEIQNILGIIRKNSLLKHMA